MAPKYQEFTTLNLPTIEADLLKRWQQNKVFEQSILQREASDPFVFYEGPPSANGMPGIHHVISRTLKDLVCRYKTMQGFQVKRKGGWDTHGLPVELGVEKELGITKKDIGTKISIAAYNKKCREAVLRYKDVWDNLTQKMGYWVDLTDPYITFDNKYIESVWCMLQQLYKKNLLYQGYSIQPYSPAAGTALSSHELNQPGTYKMVKDTTVVAMFKAIQNDKSKFLFDAVQNDTAIFFLAWTTTPWTLPSNLALAVGKNIEYVLVKTANPYSNEIIYVVLAKTLLAKHFKEEKTYEIVQQFTGADVAGISYEPLMLPEKVCEARSKIAAMITWKPIMHEPTPTISEGVPGIYVITEHSFKIILGDFVTTEDGTGIVHIAPAFGADDYRVGEENKIGILRLVDEEGKFINDMGEFSGRFVKNYTNATDYQDVNVDICVRLKKEGRAFKVEKYEHSYPHCWRTDKPIIYYPVKSWFVRTTAVKDSMIALNRTINWKPKSTGEGRFGNWLENVVDWNISRTRFWGTPLPIWENDNEIKCIGSIDELWNEIQKAKDEGHNKDIETKESINDLHRPFIDDIVLTDSKGAPMHRVPDLLDVWFDSGAMPYAQLHYPFENKNLIDNKKSFPADFICEGVDQTRGWFYTLHVLAAMLHDSVAFKNVMSNGLVLDKNGNKMSKRLGNAIDPFEVLEKYGADATRWYLVTNASPWDNLKFDVAGIQEVQRKFFGTLYNTYQFFTLYANTDNFTYSEANIPLSQRPEMDRWILSTLHTLIQKVTTAMDDYEPTAAGRAIEYFVGEQLSNWYVRLCRRRFWKGAYETDKIAAYQTLYECLETVALLVAPIAPFFSDELFQRLNKVTNKTTATSVHHASFPKVAAKRVDVVLSERMQMAQEACSLVLSLRKNLNIKVRQPLQTLLIPVLDKKQVAQWHQVEELIKTEVNVKEIVFATNTEGMVKKKAKPNFKMLGSKLGAKMKLAVDIISNMTQEQIATLEATGSVELQIANEAIPFFQNEIEIIAEDIPGWRIATKGALTIALDVTLTPGLLNECYAREVVNRIQTMRKESGLKLTDRIVVAIEANEELKTNIIAYNNYICGEILADAIDWKVQLNDGEVVAINNTAIRIHITKKM